MISINEPDPISSEQTIKVFQRYLACEHFNAIVNAADLT